MGSLLKQKGCNGLVTRKAAVALPLKLTIASHVCIQRSNFVLTSASREGKVETQIISDSTFTSFESVSCTALLFLSYFGAPDALALTEANDVAYNAAEASDFLKNAAGCAYVMLVGIFLYRVLSRRAKRAREQKLAGRSLSEQQTLPESFFEKLRNQALTKAQEPAREANAFDALLGAAQAGLFGFGLFVFSSKMSAVMSVQGLPDGYTARNISITVRTLIQGISWLATFIFCANSVGLLGLSFQMAFNPEGLKKDEEDRAARKAAAIAAGPQLPKVATTANAEELKKAFETAERMGKSSQVDTRKEVEGL
ncbi:hypothetical protein CEUSTIGMA_g2942.t1 [Chlamydomonas eustigma]|uniref:Uncharacterized protein n=1 Tax=Chlamydomonas eustigma TaxID=1157962 RepID=A0A250WXS4_9CHLO|nr:hypothetical protein CEUSTIGMA_g2942.t1 [Chlamydomonas eustigma]|eukprot:GAX75499.1 hypothetical protein CEUSTIGMA_g2942.t1 [Chlamydomonas eustigma]